MINRGSFLSTMGLAAFVIATGWIAVQQIQLGDLFHAANFKTATATGLSITQMYPTGLKHYIAKITQATQYHNGQIDLNSVHTTVYPQNNSPNWTITAKHGKILDNKNQLQLSDHVVMSRPQQQKYKAIRLTTNLINIYPNKHYAQTPERVTLTQPGTQNKISGVGMTGHSKPHEIVHLLSNVTSTYEPVKSHLAHSDLNNHATSSGAQLRPTNRQSKTITH